jgi:hypothetical protein
VVDKCEGKENGCSSYEDDRYIGWTHRGRASKIRVKKLPPTIGSLIHQSPRKSSLHYSKVHGYPEDQSSAASHPSISAGVPAQADLSGGSDEVYPLVAIDFNVRGAGVESDYMNFSLAIFKSEKGIIYRH